MSQGKGPSSGLWVMLGKLGGKFGPALFKLFKVLKFGKVTLAGLSVAGYALLFTWQFAIVIIAMLFVHEYGHLWTMKRLGIKTKGIYMIPFFGSAAVAEEEFPSRRAEVLTAIAGPLVGTGFGLASAILYMVTRNPYCAAIASWTALINLFNLLPVTPLDGGRVFKSATLSISSRLGLASVVVAMILVGVLAFEQNLIIFVILILLAFIDFLLEHRWLRKKREEYRERGLSLQEMEVILHDKLPLSREGAFVALGCYIGLAVFLWGFMLVMGHEPGAAAAMHVLQG